MAKQKFNFSAANSSIGITNTTQLPVSVSLPDTVHEEPPATPRMEIKYIPRQKIRENRKNNYPLAAIENLALSILRFGLQQPITVIYLLEEDRYVIEGGHRRTCALNYLLDKYSNSDNNIADYELYQKNVKQYEAGFPCIIKDKLSDDVIYDSPDDLESNLEQIIDSEIRLIISNSENREIDTDVKLRNVQRLTELYKKKNIGKSNKDKININEQIATDLNLKARQVANYKSLDNLVPELLQEFKNNNISLKDGSNYASLSEEEQYNILALIRAGTKVTEKDIKILKAEKKEIEDQLNQKITLLTNQLSAKEKELNSQKNVLSNTSSKDSEEYQKLLNTNSEMEEEILKLKNDLLKIKNKPAPLPLQPVSPEQAKKITTELKLKTAYETARESICRYLSLKNDFNNICTDTDFDSEALTTQLLNLLGGN